jgi:vacuolar protein sorting-associated protein 35
VKEALLLYESEITDSRVQITALTAVVGTLLSCQHFPTEDYEALITKVAQYCNKLLRKPDQCRMISLCSMLFWPPKNPDGTERYSDCDRVLECMQRALKIASVCNTSLFVEILDRCAACNLFALASVHKTRCISFTSALLTRIMFR